MSQISINEHSSIKIRSQRATLYFDPFRIKHPENDADVVFITHKHYDHLSPEDIALVMNDRTLFAAPADSVSALRRCGIDRKNIITFSPLELKTVFGIEVQALPAYNTDKRFHPQVNNWLGYLISVDGEKIYVAGDTDALPELFKITCDIAFVPVGGTYTMTASEAAELINAIKPKTAIPTHYGSIVGKSSDGESFRKLTNAGIDVKILI